MPWTLAKSALEESLENGGWTESKLCNKTTTFKTRWADLLNYLPTNLPCTIYYAIDKSHVNVNLVLIAVCSFQCTNGHPLRFFYFPLKYNTWSKNTARLNKRKLNLIYFQPHILVEKCYPTEVYIFVYFYSKNFLLYF